MIKATGGTPTPQSPPPATEQAETTAKKGKVGASKSPTKAHAPSDSTKIQHAGENRSPKPVSLVAIGTEEGDTMQKLASIAVNRIIPTTVPINRQNPYASLQKAHEFARDIPGHQKIVSDGTFYHIQNLTDEEFSSIKEKNFGAFKYSVIAFSLQDSFSEEKVAHQEGGKDIPSQNKARLISNGYFSVADLKNSLINHPEQYGNQRFAVLKEGNLFRLHPLTEGQYKAVLGGNVDVLRPGNRARSLELLADMQEIISVKGGATKSTLEAHEPLLAKLQLTPRDRAQWTANLQKLGYKDAGKDLAATLELFISKNNLKGPGSTAELKKVMAICTAAAAQIGIPYGISYKGASTCCAHVIQVVDRAKGLANLKNTDNRHPQYGHLDDWVQQFTIGFYDRQGANKSQWGHKITLANQTIPSDPSIKNSASSVGFLKPGSLLVWDNVGAGSGNGHFGIFLAYGPDGKPVIGDANGTPFAIGPVNNIQTYDGRKWRIHAIVPY